jgi:murein endopeptidase
MNGIVYLQMSNKQVAEPCARIIGCDGALHSSPSVAIQASSQHLTSVLPLSDSKQQLGFVAHGCQHAQQPLPVDVYFSLIQCPGT